MILTVGYRVQSARGVAFRRWASTVLKEYLLRGYSINPRLICRNRILQKMFIVFGRGERLGSGADIIRQGWLDNGWPEPEIHEHFGANTDRVELTLRLGTVSTPVTEHSSETSSERYAEKVKELMRRDSKKTQNNLAVILGVSDRWVEKITKKLRESGDIRRKGGRFGGEWEVLK